MRKKAGLLYSMCPFCERDMGIGNILNWRRVDLTYSTFNGIKFNSIAVP